MLCSLWLSLKPSTQPNPEGAQAINWLGKHLPAVELIDGLVLVNFLEMLDRGVVVPAASTFSRNDLLRLGLQGHGLVLAAKTISDRHDFRAAPSCRQLLRRFRGHFLSFVMILGPPKSDEASL